MATEDVCAGAKNAGTTLQSALAAAQAEFPIVPKSKTAKIKMKTGGEYSYKYADLADIFRIILPILGKHGLSVVQPLKRNEAGKLCVTTKLMHADAYVESDGLVVPEGLQPQELGSILTYWRRYDFCSLLAISPDEDTDGAAAPIQTEAKARTKSAKPSEVNEQSVLAYIVEVLADKGKKSKREYLWVTLTIAGMGKQESAICEDPKLFETIYAAKGMDATLDLRRDPNMTYPRIVGIDAASVEPTQTVLESGQPVPF